MPTITKKDLIDRIAEETKQKRSDVRTTVQRFLDEVIIELGRGNRLEFRDFGVFEIRERKPRIAQNPKTLEPVTVPAAPQKLKLVKAPSDCTSRRREPASEGRRAQALSGRFPAPRVRGPRG